MLPAARVSRGPPRFCGAMAASPRATPVEEEVDETKINVVLKNGETVYLSFLRLKRLPPALWYL